MNNTPNIQDTFYIGLLSRFMTGNPFIDPFIQMTVYGIIGIVIMNTQNILNSIFINSKYYTSKIVNLVWYYFADKFCNDSTISKKIQIHHITSRKKVNTLYKAVNWYLSNKLIEDYIKDTPLELSYEDNIYDIDIEDIDNLESNVKISDNKYKKFIFNNNEIYYILENSLLTVYTDKERQRENFSIILTTKMDKNSETDILKDFCDYCLKEYIKNQRNTKWYQKIFINTKNNEWEDQESNNKRKIETVILQNNQLNDIKDDLDDFLNSKEWYHDRGIPYTRGYLFHGKPGTGKTSLIKGISTYTKRHIHYLMLKNVSSDDQLLKLLSDIEYKDTILVIEDIDCMDDIIRERKNKYDSDLKINEEIEKLKKDMANIKENKSVDNLTEIKRELTLSGVLNAIDGVFDNDGRIMIMTTNHPDVLDKALIRPGRIDRKILFDYCTKEQIRGIYKMMFNKECNNYYITNDIDKVFSPAEVMSLFLRYKNKPEEAVKNFDKIEKDVEPIKHSLVSGIIDTNNKYSNKKQFNKSSGYNNQVIDDIYTSMDDI